MRHAAHPEQWPSRRAVCGARIYDGGDGTVILDDDPPGWLRHISCPKCLEDSEVRAAVVEAVLRLAR